MTAMVDLMLEENDFEFIEEDTFARMQRLESVHLEQNLRLASLPYFSPSLVELHIEGCLGLGVVTLSEWLMTISSPPYSVAKIGLPDGTSVGLFCDKSIHDFIIERLPETNLDRSSHNGTSFEAETMADTPSTETMATNISSFSFSPPHARRLNSALDNLAVSKLEDIREPVESRDSTCAELPSGGDDGNEEEGTLEGTPLVGDVNGESLLNPSQWNMRQAEVSQETIEAMAAGAAITGNSTVDAILREGLHRHLKKL
uniref:Uncharacterized protein n=1 Tax=Octactis speculum TaxID=3111310 RepID=A0A7S2D0G0_9STRA|mmetsp:Transcript_4210/g.4938  ORF Transcript_4210/g.4938 Transcript_4210/m.4938 type:complete len:258 (+) Transcript_4210:382-1155(+)|eukprot:CAMPEP_0185780604 /NCGR_PEP_ID=MMETSP1174-20130828/99640_1 /TAXON_ID=35687 /ORGANISM="Dictyocha speculum, Strain CCMP1381" /LENGTH=257 /DNA_ID=CAMNT_0028470231 /DNA_START=295 /DNA_END=1068 /DNA_ORIENTATION=-